MDGKVSRAEEKKKREQAQGEERMAEGGGGEGERKVSQSIRFSSLGANFSANGEGADVQGLANLLSGPRGRNPRPCGNILRPQSSRLFEPTRDALPCPSAAMQSESGEHLHPRVLKGANLVN